MANINATLQQAYVALQAFLGSPDFSHQTAANFVTPQTQQAAVLDSGTIDIPVSTVDQATNLATMFPACQNCSFIMIQDITPAPGQPFNFTTVAGGVRLAVLANGFVAWMVNGGVPPTIYLSNPSPTSISAIKVFVMSS
jgi:hypothetical protein